MLRLKRIMLKTNGISQKWQQEFLFLRDDVFARHNSLAVIAKYTPTGSGMVLRCDAMQYEDMSRSAQHTLMLGQNM